MYTMVLIKIVLILVTTLHKVFALIGNPVENLDDRIEDAKLDFIGLAEKYEYNATKHAVTTEDGYVLTLFRLNSKYVDVNKGPVLLQHGISDSSDIWIFPGPSIGLGYYLADQGYDVWCGNVRGNRYSRKHVTLDPDVDKQFWQFSFHEMGVYDFPAVIDYILNETEVPKLKYVGHSQGTTMFYVLCSKKPEYNDKISVSVSLAPAAWLWHAEGPIMQLGAKTDLNELLRYLPKEELLTIDSPLTQLNEVVCLLKYLPYPYCTLFIFTISGFNPEQLSSRIVSIMNGHMPAGMSRNSLLHFFQSARHKTFREFDYDFYENQSKYGTSTPPDYEVSKVTTPTALWCGKNDWFSSLADVQILKENLPNVVDYYVVPDDKWNHMDFLWGKDNRKFIGKRILDLFEKY